MQTVSRKAAGSHRSPLWVGYAIPLVSLLALAGVVRAHGQLPYPNISYITWDHYKYIAMAMSPLGADPLVHQAPFCWRILTPWLVHILPLSVTTGFWVVTVAGLALATLGLMWFLRALGLSHAAAVAGGLAFVLLPQATGFTLWDYMLVDPLALALQVIAMACAVSRRGPWLVCALALNAFAKETVLFAALFALSHALERRDWRMLRWSVIGLGVSGAILLGLHVAIQSGQSYSLLQQFQVVNAVYGKNVLFIVYRVVDTFGGTWGILLPLAVLQTLHAPRVSLRPSFFLLFLAATAQVLVAVNSGRVVVYAYPVVIAAALFEIEYLAAQYRFPRGLLWTVIALAQAPWVMDWTRLWSAPSRYTLEVDLLVVEAVLCMASATIFAWAIVSWAKRQIGLTSASRHLA